MCKEIYLVKVGTIFSEFEGYEHLRDEDVLTIPVSNYIESQKILFRYLDSYRNSEVNSKTVVWLEVYNLIDSMEEAYDEGMVEYIKGFYIYSYCGITKIESLVSLSHGEKQPDPDTYQNWSRIFHYIPSDKKEEYKQAKMEYALRKYK